MIEWRRVVQAYPCMTCGAAPGSKCITTSGRRSYTPHQWRSHVASGNKWRSPDEDVEPDVERVGHSRETSILSVHLNTPQNQEW